MVYYALCNIYETDEEKKNVVWTAVKHLFKCLGEYIYDRNELIEDKLYSRAQNRAVQHFYKHIHKLLKLAMDLPDHTTPKKSMNKESVNHKGNNVHVIRNRDSLFGSMDNEYQTQSRVPAPIVALLITKINEILESFERLCATKDYLTPLGIRAFTAFMLWFLPIILAPYFVWHTNNDITDIASYAWAWLFFLMLGALVDVKNILDDAFDGDSVQDDVVLDTDSILKNMKYGASPLAQSLYDHHGDDK